MGSCHLEFNLTIPNCQTAVKIGRLSIFMLRQQFLCVGGGEIRVCVRAAWPPADGLRRLKVKWKAVEDFSKEQYVVPTIEQSQSDT